MSRVPASVRFLLEAEDRTMIAVVDWLDWWVGWIDWFVPALIGLTFTLMGSLELYGLRKGIVGGHDKPVAVQLCGT
jgi:hypothetical protein